MSKNEITSRWEGYFPIFNLDNEERLMEKMSSYDKRLSPFGLEDKNSSLLTALEFIKFLGDEITFRVTFEGFNYLNKAIFHVELKTYFINVLICDKGISVSHLKEGKVSYYKRQDFHFPRELSIVKDHISTLIERDENKPVIDVEI